MIPEERKLTMCALSLPWLSAWRRFPDHSTGRGISDKALGDLTELRSPEFRDPEVVEFVERVLERKGALKRRGSKNLHRVPSLWLNISLHMNRMKLYSLRKRTIAEGL